MARESNVIEMLKAVILWICILSIQFKKNSALILKWNVCLLFSFLPAPPQICDILENTRYQICPTLQVSYIYVSLLLTNRKEIQQNNLHNLALNKISSILTTNLTSVSLDWEVAFPALTWTTNLKKTFYRTKQIAVK